MWFEFSQQFSQETLFACWVSEEQNPLTQVQILPAPGFQTFFYLHAGTLNAMKVCSNYY